jgi:hypothetical protein
MSTLLATCTSSRQQHATEVGTTQGVVEPWRWIPATGDRKSQHINLLE